MRYRPARYQAFSAQRCNIDFLQDLYHWMFVLKDDRLVFVLTCLDTYQHRRNHMERPREKQPRAIPHCCFEL